MQSYSQCHELPMPEINWKELRYIKKNGADRKSTVLGITEEQVFSMYFYQNNY